MLNSNTVVSQIIGIVKKHAPELSFTLLDVGALPVGQVEPFYWLGEQFPNARIIGFEVDDAVCKSLNEKTPDCFEYHACALGRSNEDVPFYVTKHPMCSSLYKPNVELYRYFNALDVAEIERETTIRTTTLDTFCQQNGIEQIDFMKLDVQGAELDIFQGGVAALASTVMIVTEVEFIPVYENQPLYGDVSAFLAQHDFMLHKFTDLGGRSMKPIIINNNPNATVQVLWADALFIKDIRKLDGLAPDQLLRLAVLSCLYGSVDLTFHCLGLYDARSGTDLQGDMSRAVGLGKNG